VSHGAPAAAAADVKQDENYRWNLFAGTALVMGVEIMPVKWNWNTVRCRSVSPLVTRNCVITVDLINVRHEIER
jgi:hypothetical protein